MEFPPAVAQNVLKYLEHKDIMNVLVANKDWHNVFAKGLYQSPPLNHLESFEKLMGFLTRPDLSQQYALLVNELSFTGMAADNVYMGDLDACLKLCKNVKILRLERCFHISSILVQSIAKNCPQLEQLDLPGCPLSDSVIPELTEKCTMLKKVDFSFTNMSVSSLYFIIKNCPLIEEIDLSECKDVEEIPDMTFSGGQSALTYLNLRNSLVTDPILRFVARQCPHLKTLILESCSDLSDSGIMKVANSCSELRTLDLSFCHLVTDLSIQVFTIRASSNDGGKLQELHLSACDNISAPAVHQLVQKATKLELLVLDGCDKLVGTYVKDVATYNGDEITCTFESPALIHLASIPLDIKRGDSQLKTPPPSPRREDEKSFVKTLVGLTRKKSRSLLTKRAPTGNAEQYVEAAYEERAQKIKSRKTNCNSPEGKSEEKDDLDIQIEKELELEQEHEKEKEKKLAMRRSMGSLALGEKYVIPQRKFKEYSAFGTSAVPTSSWKTKKKSIGNFNVNSQNFYNASKPSPASTNNATILLASGRRNRTAFTSNRHTISTETPVAVAAGWGSEPESWINPTQLTASSSTWSTGKAAVKSDGKGFVDPWSVTTSADTAKRSSWTTKDLPGKIAAAANAWSANTAPSVEQFVFSGTNRGKVLLKLKVETKKGGHQDLIVHEYDDPTKLSAEFCAFWDMSGYKAPLIRLITIRKNNALRTKQAAK